MQAGRRFRFGRHAYNQLDMDQRERVRRAVEAPVGEAAKLLDASPNADAHTRLTILIDGWGRGLAAGLEELAVAVRELERSSATDREISTDEPGGEPSRGAASPEGEQRGRGEARDLSEAGEEQLREEAQRSREETAALREEAPP
jgi:hypothetical protein